MRVIRLSLAAIALYGVAVGDDYSFSAQEFEQIETKPYVVDLYLKGEYKHQWLNSEAPAYTTKNKAAMQSSLAEAFMRYRYFKDVWSFQSEVMANYDNIDQHQEDTYTINQAYLAYKFDTNSQLAIGKKTPKWGKGYYINPVAFIDRLKDPDDPEASREGYAQANYTYNKVFDGDLQNLTVDLVYLPTRENGINSDLSDQNTHTAALKTYLLYRDIDIDLIYFQNDQSLKQYGIDFSTNLQTNFEIHGEYAKKSSGEYAALFGLKYLTESELTILSEYYYQNRTQDRTLPFWDRKYLITKLTQKEPLDMLYLSLYYQNRLNVSDDSHQDRVGGIYAGIDDWEVDLSVAKKQWRECQ
jgi:hypothetical protein